MASKKKEKHHTFCFQNHTGTVNAIKDSIRFVGAKHIAKKTLSGQNELRKQGLMCDVELTVDGNKLLAHRSVLSVHSEYFRAMFTTGMMESRTKEIEIKEIEFTSLEKLVDYMYTGTLDVNKDNVQDLLNAACMLQIEEVKDICSHCLLRYIDVSNCLGIWTFSEIHHLEEVYNKANHLLKSRFPSITQQEEFLILDKNILQEILTFDDLNLGMKSENVVLESVIRWLNYDLISRAKHLEELLKHVRLHLVSSELLQQVRDEMYIKDNAVCCRMIEEAMPYAEDRQKLPSHLNGPRLPASSIYVLGGYLQSRTGGNCPHTLTIERYDINQDQWKEMGKLPFNLECQNVVSVNGEMFFVHKKLKQPKLKIPTFTNVGTVHTLCTYNVIQNGWKTKEISQYTVLALLCSFKQSAVAVCKDNNVIYVCGGKEPTGSFMQKSVLKLDIENDEWSQLPNLPELRYNHSAIVVDKRLYVIGGNDVSVHIGNVRQEVKSSVVMYDPEEGCWLEKRNMNTPRLGLGLAAVDGYIYAIGGISDTARQKTVERYDPNEDTWTYVSNMHKQRSFLGVATCNNLIYAIGGKSYSNDDGGARTVLNSAEVYDPIKDEWRFISSMKTPRCMMSVSVL
ncbi:kelch-like protein 3 [Ptychodera flava]|uniref:kelch-like protein 3 n=1 Tax=Ptychodera flava TaxID=63121 RepID=UPI00396A4635